MARHIVDRPRSPAASRAARYLEIERSAGAHPAFEPLRRRPVASPEAARLQAFLGMARGALPARGQHVADGPRAPADRAARYLEIARSEGLHPALRALHSRSGDAAEVARLRMFLRKARAEGAPSGRHVADGPRAASPERAARYIELARREGIHPTVRALRTRRGDSTAMIRLREFLRIARGDTA